MNEETDLEEYAPWLLVLIMLAAGAFRVLLLATKGMSLDETVNIWLAAHKLSDMLPWLARINQQPPLYYVLLHAWIAVKGATPYYARLLSVFLGTATIPMLYLIGKRLVSPMMGLAAAVLLAASPFHIYFAQETSMYTLLTFNASVALYALVRIMTDPRAAQPIGSQFRQYLRTWNTPPSAQPVSQGTLFKGYAEVKPSKWKAWRNRHTWSPVHEVSTDLSWLLFILASVATLLSHNTAILFFITTNLIVFVGMLFLKAASRSNFFAPSLKNWIISQTMILLLTIPWLIPYLQTGILFSQAAFISPTWNVLLEMFKSFLDASPMIPPNLAIAIWSLYGLVLIVGIVFFRKKLRKLAFLLAVFVLPLLLELIASLWRPSFSVESLIWITLPLFLLLAAGVTQLKFRFAIVLMLGIFATLNIFSMSDYFRFFQKEDWNTAARTIVGHAEKNDLVLFNSNLTEIPVNYYIKMYEEYQNVELLKQGIPFDLIASGKAAPQMTAADIPALLSTMQGHPRVWLVYSDSANTDPQGLIPKTLAENLQLTESTDFNGGEVQLYIAP